MVLRSRKSKSDEVNALGFAKLAEEAANPADATVDLELQRHLVCSVGGRESHPRSDGSRRLFRRSLFDLASYGWRRLISGPWEGKGLWICFGVDRGVPTAAMEFWGGAVGGGYLGVDGDLGRLVGPRSGNDFASMGSANLWSEVRVRWGYGCGLVDGFPPRMTAWEFGWFVHWSCCAVVDGVVYLRWTFRFCLLWLYVVIRVMVSPLAHCTFVCLCWLFGVIRAVVFPPAHFTFLCCVVSVDLLRCENMCLPLLKAVLFILGLFGDQKGLIRIVIKFVEGIGPFGNKSSLASISQGTTSQ